MSHQLRPESPDRRTFFDWVIRGLGAIFVGVLGTPVFGFLMDPRNRARSADPFRLVGDVQLSKLEINRPVRGSVLHARRDGSVIHLPEVIGWVLVNRVKAGMNADCFQVFSEVCPHLGARIICNPNQEAAPGFTCPCHAAFFDLDGNRLADNPATRGLFRLHFVVVGDSLKVRWDLGCETESD